MKRINIGPTMAEVILKLSKRRVMTRVQLRSSGIGRSASVDQAVVNLVAKGYVESEYGYQVELTPLGEAAVPLCRAVKELGDG